MSFTISVIRNYNLPVRVRLEIQNAEMHLTPAVAARSSGIFIWMHTELVRPRCAVGDGRRRNPWTRKLNEDALPGAGACMPLPQTCVPIRTIWWTDVTTWKISAAIGGVGYNVKSKRRSLALKSRPKEVEPDCTHTAREPALLHPRKRLIESAWREKEVHQFITTQSEHKDFWKGIQTKKIKIPFHYETGARRSLAKKIPLTP